jgi:hypothetical protein
LAAKQTGLLPKNLGGDIGSDKELSNPAQDVIILLMKVIALYRPNTDHERTVLDYQRDFEHKTGKTIELISLDTVEGDAMAQLYDATNYPVILAVTDDGVLKEMWQGEIMPLMNDVQAYLLA